MDMIKKLLSLILRYSGLLSFPFVSKNLTIITFHRVVTEVEQNHSSNRPMMLTIAQFESIIQKISKFANPISLSEAYKYLAKKEKMPPRSIVLTFDDGYADNYKNAYPILKRYNIPATIFIATKFIDQNDTWLWWDEIEHFFKSDKRVIPDFNEGYSPEFIISLNKLNSDRGYRREAIQQFIRTTMYEIAKDERDKFISYIRKYINYSEKDLMLNWDQIKKMGNLIEFGSHTVNHGFLDVLSENDIKLELSESKKIIEKNTAKKCQFVCYPAGHVNKTIEKIASDTGYRAGVTTNRCNNSENIDLFSLDRIDAGYFLINNGINDSYFLYLLSSLYDFQAKMSR